ncbi:uncharacterized protein LOC132264243 [Phlebotomus argentipes]|uniref:uncharacterized protein LOC132264243 n=1 Tax=Phlebotomus argentipes TaxID=94469 RepID=UPI0028929F33|nr:uncharacterized protein LOC132264243 [Phlebotomus argentipes]
MEVLHTKMPRLRTIVGAILGFSMLCECSPLMSNRRPPMPRESGVMTFMLPSNATSIRADISEGFSCENRAYGYYADVANECQIFHVCLPVMFGNQRKSRTYQWSFICPEETVFSQDSFTCMRAEDMAIRCDESEKFYDLNSNFGGMMTDNDEMGQFREVTSTERAETTTILTTIAFEEGPMTTEEELFTETDMRSDLKTEQIQEVATEATFEAEPPEKVMQESESVIKTIEGIVKKAARDIERVNATSPLTRTKRKGQRRRFLFAADA